MTSVSNAPTRASTPTGKRIRRLPMPREVSAMISLSADIRPSPSNTPISVAIGTVKTKTKSLRSEEHTSELQSPVHLVCRLLLEKKKKTKKNKHNNTKNTKKKQL